MNSHFFVRKSLAALKNVYFKAEKIGHKFEKLGHKFLVSKVIKGHKWSQAESADTLGRGTRRGVAHVRTKTEKTND